MNGANIKRMREHNNMTKIRKEVGTNGISAKIIADSITKSGKRITTFELEYPRFIHSELMTHRLFTRNAASSRAIPVKKKLGMVWKRPAMPVHWGKNKSGMQADEELSGFRRKLAKFLWRAGSRGACGIAYLLYKCGVHKQITNRIVEFAEQYKIVLTATEFDNWFWLRDHSDAQPEIAELARCMNVAMHQSSPIKLNPGEWHLPYIDVKINDYADNLKYFVRNKEVDLETAKKVSASCCAQISYRMLNDSVESALKIFDKLVNSEPVHASPFEHQATPMELPKVNTLRWAASQNIFDQDGVTHIDRKGNAWSGNFKGWIQYRQLIPNNAKTS